MGRERRNGHVPRTDEEEAAEAEETAEGDGGAGVVEVEAVEGSGWTAAAVCVWVEGSGWTAAAVCV
jgi:hypothetical protein